MKRSNLTKQLVGFFTSTHMEMQIGKYLGLVLLIACFTNLMLAQTSPAGIGELKFKHLGTENGLSNSSIISITQDQEDFLWFGTSDGLNRFDGINYTIFRSNSEDSLSLSSNKIKDLFLDSDHQLWVGTAYGLNRYIKGKGFERFIHDKTNPASLGHNVIFSICEDANKKLWLGTRNGLDYYNPATRTFKHYRHDPGNPNSLLDNHVKKCFVDSQENLWVLTNKGIDKFLADKDGFRHYPIKSASDRKGYTLDPNDIREDSQGRLWVGYQDGLLLYDVLKDEFREFEIEQNGKMVKAITSQVRSIEEDENGNLWIGAYSGLYIINTTSKLFLRYVNEPSNPYSLSRNSVYAVFKDRAGDFWIGTYSGAINYFDKNYATFGHYSVASGLSYPVVSSFLQDAVGNFWISTEGGGLNYFNQRTGQFISYQHDPNNPRSLSDNNIQDMTSDKAGRIYITTHGGGLNVMDPLKAPGLVTRFQSNSKDSLSNRTDYIPSIFCDSKDRIWVGLSQEGLSQFVPETGEFITYQKSKEGPNTVWSIFEDHQNRILISINSGLWLADPSERRLSEAGLEEINRSVLRAITGIVQDHENNYWLTTQGGGLFFLQNDWSHFENFQQKDGLPSDNLLGILMDKTGDLWISSNAGLSKFNPKTRQIENFDVMDGLQSNEFNVGAQMISRDGLFWFGGLNGFTVFDPANISKNKYQASVVITNFRINNETTAMPTPGDHSNPEELVLKYNQSPFSFDFMALSYSQPEKSTYFYKLEGYNQDWVNNGDNRQTTFTFIDPGNYTFRVKAVNKDGTSSKQEAIMKLRVLPPPWRTWWAYLLYTATLLIIGLIIKNQAVLRIRDKRALKKGELEREKIEELNELKLQFFTNVSHELRTPLTLILGPLEKMLRKGNVSNSAQQQDLNLINRNAKRLLRHVNNILDFRKFEVGKLKLKAAKGDIVRFLKETTLPFQETAFQRNIEYKFVAESNSIEAFYDRDKMEIILFNLLSNAFKFTPDGGRIEVRVTKQLDPIADTDQVKLIVSDNGKGMSEEKTAFIFERFYQIKNEENGVNSGSGLGLALAKSLVELHYGTVQVISSEGKGSSFTVYLPLGSKHLKKDEIIQGFKSSEDASLYPSPEISPIRSTQKMAKKESKLKRPFLLIVEDNEEVRQFIIDCFEEEYNIYQAKNGEEGLQIALEKQPSLILSDVMMPVMDGVTFCRQLKKDVRTSHIPVILLTARTSVIFKKSGLETGANDYITKPFTPELLRLRVKNLMENQKHFQQYFLRSYQVNPEEINLSSRDQKFIADAIELVQENLSNSEFDVEFFAKALGMSRTSIFMKLKSLTGLSITEFIRFIRIKRAAQLLLQDRYSISETAYMVGFNDLKYFRTCFKKQFQCTPSQYIKQASIIEKKANSGNN